MCNSTCYINIWQFKRGKPTSTHSLSNHVQLHKLLCNKYASHTKTKKTSSSFIFSFCIRWYTAMPLLLLTSHHVTNSKQCSQSDCSIVILYCLLVKLRKEFSMQNYLPADLQNSLWLSPNRNFLKNHHFSWKYPHCLL